MRYSLICLIVFFCALSCSPKGESTLSKALSDAVKEKKVSPKKKENILVEYERLIEQDKVIARQYADQILNAIRMGGDSSHIDVVRKQVLENTKAEIGV